MARISEGKNGRLRAEFDSVSDVFRTINERGWRPNRERSSDNRGSGSFNAFDSLKDATDVYVNRPETIRKFRNSDLKLESIESPGKEIYYDVTGDGLDIGRYMDGEPEVMYNATLGNPRSIFATINISIAKVHYTDQAYINTIQRRVVRLVDWLENQGVRTQIVATQVSQCIYFSTIVKQFTDPVDLNDLAIVNHSDFLRRIVFLLMEQSKTWEYGYGNSIDYDKKMIRYTPTPDDGMYIYCGGYIPFDSTDKLEESFDNLEAKIKQMVEDGMTWNEEPLVIPGTTMDRW